MADLDAFFKKKQDKKKKKHKGGVLDLSSMAEKLERAVQEDQVETVDEAEKLANQEEFRQLRKAGEDSDWHDYVESNADMDMHGLKVKHMDLDEVVEAEDDKREEEEKAEAAKSEIKRTWKTKEEAEEGSDSEEPAAPAPAPTAAETKAAGGYVPPAQRRVNMGWGTGPPKIAPDVKSEELFPTLDVADQKAKEQELEIKKMEYNRSVKAGAIGPGGKMGVAVPVAGGGETAWSTVGAKGAVVPNDGKYRPGMLGGMRATPREAPAPTPAAAEASKSTGNAYVPPWKRAQAN